MRRWYRTYVAYRERRIAERVLRHQSLAYMRHKHQQFAQGQLNRYTKNKSR